MAIQRTSELLRLLLSARVDFVVIGGVAAIAYGSAAFTLDFDIAASFSIENLERLMATLRPYHPRYALAGDKRAVTETAEQLAKNRNLYLLTDLGRLDVVSEVVPVGDFERVAERATSLELYGLPCRILALDDLISVKAHLGRDKDRMVEKELRAIRERLRSPKG